MTHAAGLAATRQEDRFEKWRSGELELWFGASRRDIAASPIGTEMESNLKRGSLFGDLSAQGWLACIYRRLCAYAHSQAGFTNADFWQRVGPVYEPTAYVLALDELRETIAVCYVLLRICWPEFQLTPELSVVLDEPGLDDWPTFARDALAAAFT
jgi:hypothetical protein